MSFGFGIGDFVKVLELANHVRKQFVDAPKQYQIIARNVRNLWLVLTDAEAFLDRNELQLLQSARFRDIISQCKELLKTIDDKLAESQDLAPASSRSLNQRGRRLWKRLIWDSTEEERLTASISRCILALNNILTMHNVSISQSILKAVTDLVDSKGRKQRQELLNWISPFDHGSRQTSAIHKRHFGTGQWIFASEQYNMWFRNPQTTLLATGKPGVGKTILCAIVIESLTAMAHVRQDVAVAYFYFSSTRPYEHEPLFVLSSILRQILEFLLVSPESLKQLYTQYSEKCRKLSIDEVLKQLQVVCEEFDRVYIFLDALDECTNEHDERFQLLNHLQDLQQVTALNFFAISRDIPEVTTAVIFTPAQTMSSIRLEILAQEEDIRMTLNGRIKALRLVTMKPELGDAIRETIIKAVNGIFLLAELHLNSLKHKNTIKALTVALQHLPTGSDACDQAYEQTMQRIKNCSEDDSELALCAIAYVVLAQRELTSKELLLALAIEPDTKELDLDNVPDISTVISLCMGLVVHDTDTDTVRLAHPTALEYFKRIHKNDNWLQHLDLKFANACITYLSFVSFGEEVADCFEQIEIRSIHSFYEYAATHWGSHAGRSNLCSDLAQAFLRHETNFRNAAIQLFLAEGMMGIDTEADIGSVALEVFSHFKLVGYTETLLAEGVNPNGKGIGCKTGLIRAALLGHVQIVKLLLQHDEIQPNQKSNWGQDALETAAGRGHHDVVQLLVQDRKVIEAHRDPFQENALSSASANGHEKVVRVLLDSPLADDMLIIWRHCPSKEEHMEVPGEHNPKSIIKIAGDVPDDIEFSILASHAAKQQLLHLKLSDDEWLSSLNPLVLAIQKGHTSIVGMLLEAGVKPKGERQIVTLISLSVSTGDISLVSLLLKDWDPSSKKLDKNGSTPLIEAANLDNVVRRHIIRLLLDTKPDLTVQDRHGFDILNWVALNGDWETMQMLLNEGADCNIRAGDGQTPLIGISHAINTMHSSGLPLNEIQSDMDHCVEIVKALLAKGADVKIQDNTGSTALSWLLKSSPINLELLKILLDHGASVDITDSMGLGPLFWCLQERHRTKKHSQAIRILLKYGADANAAGVDGIPLLSWAALYRLPVEVQLLLEAGADVNAADPDGTTTLMLASGRGYLDVVNVLLKQQNVNVVATDSYGRHAIQLAEKFDRKNVVEVLQKHQKKAP